MCSLGACSRCRSGQFSDGVIESDFHITVHFVGLDDPAPGREGLTVNAIGIYEASDSIRFAVTTMSPPDALLASWA